MTFDLRRLLAVLAIVPFFAIAACGGSSDEGDGDADAAGGGTGPCTSAVAPAADASAKPPADFPSPDGTVWFQKEAAGETTVYFGYVDGDDVVETRDGIKDSFDGANLEIEGTDQEDNVEAELEFAGAHQGSVQVIHLCEGKLRIRYRVEG
jgi:hypothetical protein